MIVYLFVKNPFRFRAIRNFPTAVFRFIPVGRYAGRGRNVTSAEGMSLSVGRSCVPTSEGAFVPCGAIWFIYLFTDAADFQR